MRKKPNFESDVLRNINQLVQEEIEIEMGGVNKLFFWEDVEQSLFGSGCDTSFRVIFHLS